MNSYDRMYHHCTGGAGRYLFDRVGTAMKEKWSDGPWTVGYEFVGDDCALAVLNADGDEICNFGNTLLDEDAHANILAAAAEMYAEIKAMCRAELELGSCKPSDCGHCPMNKVLKKARGES